MGSTVCRIRRLPSPGAAWTSDTLRAEGLIGGQVAAEHTVRTPAAGRSLSVRFDTTDVPADGSELVFVYASILDVNGTPAVTRSDKTCGFFGVRTCGTGFTGLHFVPKGELQPFRSGLETPGPDYRERRHRGLTAEAASFSTQ